MSVPRTSRSVMGALLVCLAGMVGLVAFPASADEVAKAAEVGRDLPSLPPKSLRAPDPPTGWLTQHHGWLKIIHDPDPKLYEPIRRMLRDADGIRQQLSTVLGQKVLESVEVRVARSPDEMAAVSPPDAPPPTFASGVAYAPLHMVVLARKSREGFDSAGVDESFRHQLSHLALFDATAGRAVPRWLQEGFAIWASGENGLKRIQTLWTAQLQGRVLSLSQLDSFPNDPPLLALAYAQSADFVRFLMREPDRSRFSTMIARVRGGEPFERALLSAYTVDLPVLEYQWRQELTSRYLAFPLLAASGAVGMLMALGLVLAWRRRRRRHDEILRRWANEEAAEDLRADAIRAAAARAEVEHEHARLLVVDQGVGHVVYIVEQKPVPKVEHDGEVHTLH